MTTVVSSIATSLTPEPPSPTTESPSPRIINDVSSIVSGLTPKSLSPASVSLSPRRNNDDWRDIVCYGVHDESFVSNLDESVLDDSVLDLDCDSSSVRSSSVVDDCEGGDSSSIM